MSFLGEKLAYKKWFGKTEGRGHVYKGILFSSGALWRFIIPCFDDEHLYILTFFQYTSINVYKCSKSVT